MNYVNNHEPPVGISCSLVWNTEFCMAVKLLQVQILSSQIAYWSIIIYEWNDRTSNVLQNNEGWVRVVDVGMEEIRLSTVELDTW